MAFYLEKMESAARQLLQGDEEILLTIKESLLSDIAPSFIIATNKRVIIINNSFWGLYLGHNLLTPTDLDVILYRQITSVILVKGRIFSSIDMRLLGGFESKVSPQKKTEGEIDGLRGGDAVKLAKFVDKMVAETRLAEQSRVQPEAATQGNIKHKDSALHLKLYYAFKGILQDTGKVNEVSLNDALEIIDRAGVKFVWLGTEPLEYISKILHVDEHKIIRLDPDEIQMIDKDVIKTLSGYVFVCYNGNLSKYVSEYLNSEYQIEAYNLKGGIMKAIGYT